MVVALPAYGYLGSFSNNPTIMVQRIMDKFERELLLEIHPFFPLNQDYRRKGTYMDA